MPSAGRAAPSRCGAAKPASTRFRTQRHPTVEARRPPGAAGAPRGRQPRAPGPSSRAGGACEAGIPHRSGVRPRPGTPPAATLVSTRRDGSRARAAGATCAHCQRGSPVVPDTLGTTIKSTSQLPGDTRTHGASGLRPIGGCLDLYVGSAAVTCLEICCSPSGLPVSGQASGKVSRAGCLATSCERGRGSLALAGTPIA
jgi:hypothetical protein